MLWLISAARLAARMISFNVAFALSTSGVSLAGAYAEFAGNLVDAFSCAQLLLDALFNLLA